MFLCSAIEGEIIMKNTYFKSVKVALSCALVASMCLAFPTMTKAASVRNVPVKKEISADVTGDGKMDKILVKTIIGKDDCVSRVKITVNNKLAYSKSYANQGINSVNAKYARMTNKNEFVQLMAIGDNDCINVNKIYRYDNKSKKFVCVSKLDDTACEIVSAKKNSLTLKHADQPAETGWLNWTMDYRVSNNKLVLADTTTSTVKSIIGNDRNDYYSKLFKKNTFVTAKKVNLYNGSKVACKVPAGKKVVLKKLTLSNGKIYLEFKYGKKAGWISVNNENYNYRSPYFKSVSNQLVG